MALQNHEAFAELEKLVEESLRWTRDHKGEKYKHAIPCEWCMQQGLFHAMSVLSGSKVSDLRMEYTAKINTEKKPRTKSKVVRRRPETTAAPKRKIVRKKK